MGHKYQPIPRKGEIHDKAWGHELWIINHDLYCGKLLVFNKGKKFSMHYHLIKEESWYVAEGEFEYSWIDTEKAEVQSTIIRQGDVVDLEIGQPHQLKALTEGATIFEVSTKHYNEDSYRVFKGDAFETQPKSRDLTQFWSLNNKLVDFTQFKDLSTIPQNEAEVKYGWEACMYWANIIHKELDNEFFTIEPGDVYVDLGSNVGMNCAYAESKGASQIYAIEPDPDVFEALKENAGSNWTLEQIAVSNKNGFMEISIWPNWQAKRIIRCTTLDDIVKKHNIEKINYLKMDIEGGEKEAIHGISPETWAKIDKIFIEYHEDVFGYSEEARTEFIKTIHQHGFNFHVKLGSIQTFMYFWKS